MGGRSREGRAWPPTTQGSRARPVSYPLHRVSCLRQATRCQQCLIHSIYLRSVKKWFRHCIVSNSIVRTQQKISRPRPFSYRLSRVRESAPGALLASPELRLCGHGPFGLSALDPAAPISRKRAYIQCTFECSGQFFA